MIVYLVNPMQHTHTHTQAIRTNTQVWLGVKSTNKNQLFFSTLTIEYPKYKLKKYHSH